MEGGTAIGRRMTISDHLAVSHSANLRDDDHDHIPLRRRHRTGRRTLASILQTDDDKNTASKASSSGRGRTLRDVLREDEENSGIQSAASSGTVRVSLMTLMGMREREEEEDAVGIISCNSGDVEEEEEENTQNRMMMMMNGKHVCCVCMVREKGAAFIPCGHTFCRVCSRELLLRRGNCPLCNASILDLLHIF